MLPLRAQIYRDFADSLGRIRVEDGCRCALTDELAYLGYRLDRAGFIVGRHYGHEADFGSQAVGE